MKYLVREKPGNFPFSPFLIRLYQAIYAPGRSVATSLFLSFKNTKTEHKCSVFRSVLLKPKELPVSDRTLCSVWSQTPKKLNSLSDLIIPQRLCGEWLRNALFSDYLTDSNNFKNILLACDRFGRVIQMPLKCTPKCILLAK